MLNLLLLVELRVNIDEFRPLVSFSEISLYPRTFGAVRFDTAHHCAGRHAKWRHLLAL